MRPAWQQSPCPAWCSGGHDDADHPDDRVHRSSSTSVPVISRRLIGVDPTEYVQGISDYEVGLVRRDGESMTWLFIGSGPEEYVEVSLESGHGLWEAVRRVVS